MPKSITNKSVKPRKPYPDFPLFAHDSRQWCKKIRGRHHYFGPWSDPEGALERYLRNRDALQAGRKRRPYADGLTLRELVNRHLTWKQRQVEGGDIIARTFRDHYRVAEIVLDNLGKDRLVDDLESEDFGQLRAKIARDVGPYALTKRVQITRAMFDFAFDSGLIPRPITFGPEFRKPPEKALRQAKQSRPPRLLEAKEIRDLIAAAPTQMKAMILLGVNAAYGNSDIGALPIAALDLDAGIATSPRSKNAIQRRAILWPETIVAIRQAIEERPDPKHPDYDKLVFLTRCGFPWVRDEMKLDRMVVPIDAVGSEFSKLQRKLGIKRPGVGFYSLRHSFRDRADECPDRSAIDYSVGHSNASDMKNHYVHKVTDKRLKVISDHVRKWIFPKKRTARNTKRSR